MSLISLNRAHQADIDRVRMAASVARVSSLRPVSGSAEEILHLLREWDAAEDPAPLVIATSGSTGEPKRVVLSRAAMRSSALATQDRLGGPGRWVLNLPPSYVAGVQVLYRSIVAGTVPVLDQDAAAPTGRTYLSLVPTQLYRALEHASAAKDLTRFDAVLVGGGPLSPQVRAEAEAHGIRIVQTYGMSETCGGCVYDGMPLAGVDMRIGDDEEVLLRGPMLFDGYEGEPERTAQAMRDGWFHTGDSGRIEPDGRLRITGRLDDVIISGGVKVPGLALAARVATHPQVQRVEVIGVPDDEWGQRVVAFVVGGVELETLRDHVAEELPRSWAPRQVVCVAELPLMSNGKVDRQRLRELA
jgi:o-succinylbenzoate---CoA ligase